MPRGAHTVAWSFVWAWAFHSTTARAQPDLPPPPPPPIGQLPQEAPALPRSDTVGEPARRSELPASAPRRTRVHHRVDVAPDAAVISDAPHVRAVSVVLNPLGLPWGRVSADVDVMPWGPHHALVISPHALVASTSRGGSTSLLSEGFGFASTTSGELGIELGYQYGALSERSMRGPFFGPSLLLGTTTQATVGDPSHGQLYWGFAFDGRYTEVLTSGLTLGGGLGLGYLRMAAVGVVVPRILAQVGWSF